MENADVAAILVEAVDWDYANRRDLDFGQWMQDGFTLEQGDRKFKVTVTEA